MREHLLSNKKVIQPKGAPAQAIADTEQQAKSAASESTDYVESLSVTKDNASSKKNAENGDSKQKLASQKASAKNESQAIMAHEKPLPVLLIDAGLTFTHVQQEILALAQHLQAQGFAVVLACPEHSALQTKAQEAGFDIFTLRAKGQDVSLGLRLSLRLLWRFKKKDPLCIHVFSPDCLGAIHRLVKWRLQGATLTYYSAFTTALPASKAVEASESPAFTLSAPMLKYLECIDKVIVPSSYIRSTWAHAGLEASRLKVIRTALSKENTALATPSSERFIFLVMTDFIENSCLDVLFGAMLEVEKNDFSKPWEVRVVGEGPDFGTYVQRAEDLGVAWRLSLLSTLDEDFPLQATLPHAHVLILPQLGPQGNIHACMNAWALGLPIIASNIMEYTELTEVAARICRGSKGGILSILPQDAKALAAAMQQTMEDTEKYTELAKESAHMRNYALLPRLQDTYLEVYKGGIASFGWVIPKKKA